MNGLSPDASLPARGMLRLPEVPAVRIAAAQTARAANEPDAFSKVTREQFDILKVDVLPPA